ncbi:MAG: mannosyltransferase [Chitinophagaceae bacterium]
MSRHLHIVCLDNPYPPDYGGAIDMFYKIVALQKAGIHIHLHYFAYNGRTNEEELKKYCYSIHSYERQIGSKGFSFRLPYIVSSRINKELVARLNNDDHPIILEGLHCTGILQKLDMSKRKVLVRLHNDESRYYQKLSVAERNWFNKFYFRNESRLLKKYQRLLPANSIYASISSADAEEFQRLNNLPSSFHLRAFVAWQQVIGKEGVGNFCLYHGNLSVAENEKAACWLLDKVFTKIKVPLVIAGKAPSACIKKRAHLCQHTCLVADPSEKEMNDLVQKAHINILPSFNSTGIKLKLLHALFEGRHCVVNDAAVEGTGLEATCHIGNSAEALASIIMQLYHHPFAEEEIRLRKKVLLPAYDNNENAKKIIAWLY